MIEEKQVKLLKNYALSVLKATKDTEEKIYQNGKIKAYSEVLQETPNLNSIKESKAKKFPFSRTEAEHNAFCDSLKDEHGNYRV